MSGIDASRLAEELNARLEQGIQFLCQPRGINSAHSAPPPSRLCRSVRRFKARLRLSLSAAARSKLQ